MDENYVRKRMTKLEFSKVLIERQDILKSLGIDENFVKKIQHITGDSSSTISRRMKIGKGINDNLAGALQGTASADNQNSLLTLSEFSPSDQDVLALELNKLPSEDKDNFITDTIKDKVKEAKNVREAKAEKKYKEEKEEKPLEIKEHYDSIEVKQINLNDIPSLKNNIFNITIIVKSLKTENGFNLKRLKPTTGILIN
jgi:hypothetical protein